MADKDPNELIYVRHKTHDDSVLPGQMTREHFETHAKAKGWVEVKNAETPEATTSGKSR